MSARWKQTATSEELLNRAVQNFKATFNVEPAGVYSAPGRVNLLGEHIDYCGGTVLPFALPQRTFAAMAPRADGQVRAVTAQGDAGAAASGGEVKSVALAEVEPGKLSGWLSYVAGVPWAMEQESLGSLGTLGADIAIDSSVPLGAGLSSSAALECSVAVGFDDLLSATDSSRERLADTDSGRAALATACIRAENEIAGASTGGMDQSISLRAQQGAVLAIDCRDFSVKPLTIDVDSAGLAILVIDTRAHHNLSDGQYAARRASTEVAREALGLSSLRDAFSGTPTLAAAENLLADWDSRVESLNLPDSVDRGVIRDALHHVWTEIARVEECVALFSGGSVSAETWARLGELLNGSHDSLRDQYRVSCPELDLAVDAARVAGALGARMTGGGFGGSAIALVPSNEVEYLAESVAAAFEKADFTQPEFLVATPSGAAGKEG
ncbi:galactokinase [Rothia aerolata]|uniref:Galactokinase n=1 Tax=Rothia aerolata TaxID=1812262 RepID=A0A917MVB5_9MICC|nr:galactokinase [Rothia aerolata]GGH65885.1 galactokinase [Rothia aerolata]